MTTKILINAEVASAELRIDASGAPDMVAVTLRSVSVPHQVLTFDISADQASEWLVGTHFDILVNAVHQRALPV